jgi:hypothetical protein
MSFFAAQRRPADKCRFVVSLSSNDGFLPEVTNLC